MTARHQTEHSGGTSLEIVLKCDSAGSLEAVSAALSSLSLPGATMEVVHRGMGNVSKSDVLLAETSGRLIIGYQVGLMPGMDKILREHRVDVRLYEVIFTLTADMESLARQLIPSPPAEEVIGTAKVIALFKSTRKGIIIGCEVTRGHIAVGQHFRVISAMGPIYSGTISSIHKDQDTIQKAVPGQQVGIKITDFGKVRVGDLVEAFRSSAAAPSRPRQPRGEVIRK